MTIMRMCRAVGAAVALAAASGMLVGGGATAATAAPTVGFNVSPGFDRTVPVRAGGHGDAYRPLSLTFYTGTLNPLLGVQVMVDGSALRGFAELNQPAGCSYTSADHLRERCALGDVRKGSGGFAVGVRATAGAKAGASGRVVFSVTARNGKQWTDPSNPKDTIGVTVGDGPDLAINDLGRSIKVTPGTNTPVPLRVTNLGSSDAKGVVVFIHDQLDVATVLGNYSNCVYQTQGHDQRGAYCTFKDAVVKPGQTLELKNPFTLAIPAGAHGDEIQYGAGLVGDDWIGIPEGKQGTGGELTLVPVAGPQTGAVRADETHDIDEENNLHYTELVTGNVTDISGVGGTVDAVAGKDTAVTFGARNTGTTVISKVDGHFRGSVWIYALFPTSVQVVSTPKGCTTSRGGPEGLSAYPFDGSAPNAVTYQCASSVPLKPGEQARFTFHIKPVKVVDGEYAGVYAGADEDRTADQSDNTARMDIHAAKAGTQPSPLPTATGTKGGNSNGTTTKGGTSGSATPNGSNGGHLATTGSGEGTLWAAGGAVVAVALGLGGVLAGRRRKGVSHG